MAKLSRARQDVALRRAELRVRVAERTLGLARAELDGAREALAKLSLGDSASSRP